MKSQTTLQSEQEASYNIWHYKRQQLFIDKFYDGIIREANLTGEELSLPAFFYTARYDNKNYLIPSKIVEDDHLPFKILESEKIGVAGRAYHKINNVDPRTFKPEITKSYKEHIDEWLKFEHLTPKEYTLWKLIVDALYDYKLAVEVMSYPGWMKNSPIESHKLLLGYCECVEEPSYAKLKLFINSNMQHICLDELNEINNIDAADIKKYIISTCDGRTSWTNPKRASQGVKEGAKIVNLSTSVLYNFPDDKLSDNNKKMQLRYFHKVLGHTKVNRRLYPLLFMGGDQNTPACQEKWELDSDIVSITDEEYRYFRSWVNNKKGWSQESVKDKYSNKFKINHKQENNTWDKYYRTICKKLMMYSEDQEEFNCWEKLLSKANENYTDYVNSYKN